MATFWRVRSSNSTSASLSHAAKLDTHRVPFVKLILVGNLPLNYPACSIRLVSDYHIRLGSRVHFSQDRAACIAGARSKVMHGIEKVWKDHQRYQGFIGLPDRRHGANMAWQPCEESTLLAPITYTIANPSL